MKKLIIVMLVAVLASSFAFAGLSGDASVQFQGDFDKKEFGFLNGQNLKFNFSFTSDSIAKIGEEDIHVELEAGAALSVEPKRNPDQASVGSVALGNHKIYLDADIETAKIAGSNWYVSILGADGLDSFAKPTKTKVADYVTDVTPVDGIEVGVADFVASVSFWKDDKGTALSGTIKTPEFKFADEVVTFKAEAGAGKAPGTGFAVAGFGFTTTAKVQDVNVAVAADLGIENITKEFDALKFVVDTRLDVGYKFVSTFAYFQYNEGEQNNGETDPEKKVVYFKDLYLEAGADFKLKDAFDVPVTVSVWGTNLLEPVGKSGVALKVGASAEYAKEPITVGVAGEFGLNNGFDSWNANVYGQYVAEKFTAGGSVGLGGNKDKAFNALNVGAYATTDALVNGATFGVSYGYTTVTANLGTAKDSSKYGNNFLGDKYGMAGVYCKIAF